MNGLATTEAPTVLPEQVTVVRQVLRIPLGMIQPFADQPRHHFDAEKLQELAASMKVAGQIIPAIVRPLFAKNLDGPHKYELVDGQRRLLAAEIAGITHIEAIPEWEAMSVQAQFERSAAINFCREAHTPLETFAIMIRVRDGVSPPRSHEQIAKLLGCHQTRVSQYLRFEGMDPRVLEGLKPETEKLKRITVNHATALSMLPRETQYKGYQNVVKHQLSVQQTRKFVEHWLNPTIKGVRGRTIEDPNKALAAFTEFARGMKNDSDVFAGKSLSHFKQTFAGLTGAQIRHHQHALEKAAENLQLVLMAVGKVLEDMD